MSEGAPTVTVPIAEQIMTGALNLPEGSEIVGVEWDPNFGQVVLRIRNFNLDPDRDGQRADVIMHEPVSEFAFGLETDTRSWPSREAVIAAIRDLNAKIDAPLLARGFDRDSEEDGAPSEVAYVLTRTMKLVEELGETMEAINGRLALNFRKGRTEATWLTVVQELNDIAATAVLAATAIGGGDVDPIADLEHHIVSLARRAQE